MAAPKKKGLGRGLEDLLNTNEISIKEMENGEAQNVASGETGAGGILYLDINEIAPNENQPRKEFNEEKIDELAASIEAYGLIQPIILRKTEQGYEIVAGERRWRAARKANLKKVPCIVKELTEEENMVISIIENMQREDLNPIEEAEALQQMLERFELSQEQVSRSVGKSRSYIANSLRLLKLPEEVRRMVQGGELSNGHGRAILAISDEKKQVAVAKRAVEQGLSVRDVENLAKLENAEKPKSRPAKRVKEANLIKLEEELKMALGTKVNLKPAGKKGKIEIEYYSREELERLIEILKG